MNTRSKRPDRRKGPDPWIKSLTWFGIIGWIFMLVAMAVFHKARPESERSITGFLQKTLGTQWDMELVPYFISLSAFILLISLFGLYVNSQRNNRKNDSYRMSLVSLVVFSILGLLYYIF